ncbi:unnamed protein product [Allacma fusca]|uniref:Uncharacterized protein n=1 Tax=Allacma fusca TaxID=39272 RepID=A0A8J2PAW5_9HEXA|nr:unnamed protein product [Allacma fusca]
MYSQFVVFFYSIPTLNQALLIIIKYLIPPFISKYTAFFKYFEDNFNEKFWIKPKEIKICEQLLKTVHTCWIFNIFFFPMLCIFRPSSPEQLSSLFSDPYSWKARLVGTIFQAYYIYSFASVVLFQSCYLGLFLLPMLTVLTELSVRTATFTKATLKYPANIFKIYGALRLLFTESTSSMSLFVFIGKMELIVMAIYGIYGVIRLDGIVSYMMGVTVLMSVIVLPILLSKLAELHSRSMHLLEQVSIRGNFGRKIIKSLPLLRFQFGSMYYADKQMVLTKYSVRTVSARIKISVRAVMNGMFQISARLDNFSEKFWIKPKEIKTCEQLLKTVHTCWIFNIIFFPMLCIFRPSSPEQLSSLFSDPVSWKARLVGTIFQAYYTYSYASVVMFLGCYVGLFLFPMLVVISESSARTASFTKATLKYPANIFKIYRALRLLFGEATSSVSLILYIAKMQLITMAIYGIYGVIRLDGIISYMMGVSASMSMIILPLLLSKLGEFHVASMHLLEQVSKRGNLDRKILKSLPLLRFQFGSMYYADKQMVLTIIQIVLVNSANLLILY